MLHCLKKIYNYFTCNYNKCKIYNVLAIMHVVICKFYKNLQIQFFFSKTQTLTLLKSLCPFLSSFHIKNYHGKFILSNYGDKPPIDKRSVILSQNIPPGDLLSLLGNEYLVVIINQSKFTTRRFVFLIGK